MLETLKTPDFQAVYHTEFVSFLYFFDYKSLGGGKKVDFSELRVVPPADPRSDELLPPMLTPENPAVPNPQEGSPAVGKRKAKAEIAKAKAEIAKRQKGVREAPVKTGME